MRVELYSGAYRIIATGQVFLFEKADVFSIELPDVEFYVDIVFVNSNTEEQYINTSIKDDRLLVSCVNFKGYGTGAMAPLSIGTINGKDVYLSLWSELMGREQMLRKVEYTLFERDRQGDEDGI